MLKKTNVIAIGISLMFAQLSHAQASSLDDFTLRLAKTADNKDAEKPAILGYQRNDGGVSNYMTEGALKADYDFGQGNSATFTPSAAWNHNTLSTTSTNNWSYGLGLTDRSIVTKSGDALVYSGSLSQQRDMTKDSNASIVKAGATWYGWPEWKKEGAPDYAAIRPTITLFTKHVYSAQADKTTGVTPTGTMSGVVVSLDAAAVFGRWSIAASAQALQPSQVVAGDTKYTHRLSVASVTYQFVDPPLTGAQQKATGWVPGVSLIRQVGDDPLNAVNRAGYTQLVLTIQY